VTASDGFPASVEEWHALEQACFDQGLLARGFGRLPRITKKGRELVKLYAVQDDEVREALQSALAEPLLERRSAFVSLLKFVVLRRDGRA
jgi:hypothetical protein